MQGKKKVEFFFIILILLQRESIIKWTIKISFFMHILNLWADAVTLSDRTVAFIMYRYSLLKPLMQKKKNVHNRDGVARRGIGGWDTRG